MLQWVLPELEHVLQQERAGRERAVVSGTVRTRRLVSKVGLEEKAEDDAECCVCHYYCHLGGLVCDCDPTRCACLLHGKQVYTPSPPLTPLPYTPGLYSLLSQWGPLGVVCALAIIGTGSPVTKM